MKRDIINLVGFSMLLIAGAIGVVANVLTIIHFDGAVNTIWEKFQAITFIIVLSILCLLSIYFIVVNIKRLIQDIKINKE